MNDIVLANEKQLDTAKPLEALKMEAVADAWAKATTKPGTRTVTIKRDKKVAVFDFYAYTGVPPWLAVEDDVLDWHGYMRLEGEEVVTVVYEDGTTIERTEPLSENTIYKRHGEVRRFWQWLKDHAQIADAMPEHSPFVNTQPKPQKAYKGSKALTDEELVALLEVVRGEAKYKLTAKRDFALLDMFVTTGHRREEVLRLKWKDLKRTNGTVLVHFLTKGGDYESEEVSLVWYDKLLEYLVAAERLEGMEPDTPLWVGHDAAGQASGQLSSHAFAKNLKRYARLAGLEDIHVHQFRHTVARMVGEDTGDLTAVQKVLGHKNLQTTRVYLRQVSTKKDTHSAAIRARLNL